MYLEKIYKDLNEILNFTKNFKERVEEVTYLKSISIKNYFSLKDVPLDDLENKREIYILGENGDGKTLFLQAILLALRGDESQNGMVENFIEKTLST